MNLVCKSALAAIVFLTISCGNLFADELKWLDDFDQAKKQAAQQEKMILAYFTGSDWCRFCIMADEEIISKPAFAKYVSDKFILLKLDFPRQKRLPAALAAKNNSLSEKYNVQGFPTQLILDSKGSVLGKTGYVAGGADAWIASCDEILSSIPKPKIIDLKRDFGLALAQARKDKLPILLFVYDKKDESSFKKIANATSDYFFGVLEGWKFVTVAVELNDLKNIKELAAIKHAVSQDNFKTSCRLVESSSLDQENSKAIEIAQGDAFLKNLHNALECEYQGQWMQNMEQAKTVSKLEGKAILIKFTGSDWCSWCVKMDDNIFSKTEFANFAKKNLVLVELDFPRSKKLSAEITKQNKMLASKYGIETFPSIVILNSQGNEVVRGNYYSGSVTSFIEAIKSNL